VERCGHDRRRARCARRGRTAPRYEIERGAGIPGQAQQQCCHGSDASSMLTVVEMMAIRRWAGVARFPTCGDNSGSASPRDSFGTGEDPCALSRSNFNFIRRVDSDEIPVDLPGYKLSVSQKTTGTTRYRMVLCVFLSLGGDEWHGHSTSRTCFSRRKLH